MDIILDSSYIYPAVTTAIALIVWAGGAYMIREGIKDKDNDEIGFGLCLIGFGIFCVIMGWGIVNVMWVR